MLIYLHLSVLILKQLILKRNLKKTDKDMTLKAIERKGKDNNYYLDIDIELPTKY